MAHHSRYPPLGLTLNERGPQRTELDTFAELPLTRSRVLATLFYCFLLDGRYMHRKTTLRSQNDLTRAPDLHAPAEVPRRNPPSNLRVSCVMYLKKRRETGIVIYRPHQCSVTQVSETCSLMKPCVPMLMLDLCLCLCQCLPCVYQCLCHCRCFSCSYAPF